MNFKQPFFIENSRVPVWLSKFAPIDIWAISFGCWVWCRGKISDRTKQHETIHYFQQLELFFVFQWMLYILFWCIGYARYRDGKKAYRENPFEREAYKHEAENGYISKRRLFAWTKEVLK